MSNHNENEEDLKQTRFNHFMKDLEDDIIDFPTINCALYHMGYLLVGKTELHNHTSTVKNDVNFAHNATRARIEKKSSKF